MPILESIFVILLCTTPGSSAGDSGLIRRQPKRSIVDSNPGNRANQEIALTSSGSMSQHRAGQEEKGDACTDMHKVEGVGDALSWCEGACTDPQSNTMQALGFVAGTCQENQFSHVEHDLRTGVFLKPSNTLYAAASGTFQPQNATGPLTEAECNFHHYVDESSGVCQTFCAPQMKTEIAQKLNVITGGCSATEYTKFIGEKSVTVYAQTQSAAGNSSMLISSRGALNMRGVTLLESKSKHQHRVRTHRTLNSQSQVAFNADQDTITMEGKKRLVRREKKSIQADSLKNLQISRETQAEVLEVKADVKAGTKAEVEELKAEVKEMKAEMLGVKAEVKEMKADEVGLRCQTRIEDIKTNMSQFDCIASSAGVSLAHWTASHREAVVAFLEDHTSTKGVAYTKVSGQSATLKLLQELQAPNNVWTGATLSFKSVSGDISKCLQKFDALKAAPATPAGLPSEAAPFTNAAFLTGLATTSIGLTGPMGALAGATASIAFSFFTASQPSADEALYGMLQSALTALYTQIMSEVAEYVDKAVLENQLQTDHRDVQNQLYTVADELAWVPNLLSAANGNAGVANGMLAWLLMIQHNLAELKTPILSAQCLQTPLSQGSDFTMVTDHTYHGQNKECKLWQGRGTFIEGIIFGQLHISILTQVASLDDSYVFPIAERISGLTEMYHTMLTRSMDTWKIAKYCQELNREPCGPCLREWFIPIYSDHQSLGCGIYGQHGAPAEDGARCNHHLGKYGAPAEDMFRNLVEAFGGTCGHCGSSSSSSCSSSSSVPRRRRSYYYGDDDDDDWWWHGH